MCSLTEGDVCRCVARSYHAACGGRHLRSRADSWEKKNHAKKRCHAAGLFLQRPCSGPGVGQPKRRMKVGWKQKQKEQKVVGLGDARKGLAADAGLR